MPCTSEPTSATDQLVLAQFGGRLKRARIRQRLTASDVASSAGLSRTTLRAVEAGELTPTIGSYLRVMSVLGVSKDLALLAAEAEEAPDSRNLPLTGKPVVTDRAHELQDLQSLVLHQEAVRLMKRNPILVQKALSTLNAWKAKGSSRSQVLWDDWSAILQGRNWRRALANTQRARELRQASLLATILPAETRMRILKDVQQLRAAVSGSST